MKEINEEAVSLIVGRIYRDTIVSHDKSYFVKRIYKISDFEEIAQKEVLHSILGFLPNTKYRGAPFVMSVIFDKRLNHYEIMVLNPNTN